MDIEKDGIMSNLEEMTAIYQQQILISLPHVDGRENVIYRAVLPFRALLQNI